ncbi:hypothetical protein ACFLZJ_01775 [Nanoarchaeota archaeon]
MLKKFLKEVVTLVVGKQAEEIADLLDSKKHVNEFAIAKKLDITINQTRNILYKIADQGLVSSIRKKDKRKGWYTYFWKIEILKALEFLKKNTTKRINQIEYQVKSRETKEFYVCETCGIEFNEENALLHDFTCSECGGIFSRKDNTKMLRELQKHLIRLKQELDLIEEEIEKEELKMEKKKTREIKKEVKEKAKKRAVAAAKRKAARIKAGKVTKKKVKKKPIKKKKKKKKKVKKKIIKRKPKKKSIRKKKAKKKKPVKKKRVKKKIVKKKIVRKKPTKKKISKKKVKKKPVRKLKKKIKRRK